MRVFRILVCLLGMLWHGAALAQTAPAPFPSHVTIRLLPERGTVAPGEELWIGIEQTIAPGWHTYWKNPGDSGTPPRISWTLPEGFTVGDIEWPAPRRMPYGPLMNYGYEDHVILLQRLKAPPVLPEGPITLAAKVDILVCADECIPESGTYSFTLNAAESAEDNTALLEEARAKIPVPVSWLGGYAEKDGHFVLMIPALSGADNITFFPEDWGLVDNAAPQVANFKDNALTIAQQRGDRPLDGIDWISGVLTATDAEGKPLAVSFRARQDVSAPPAESAPAPARGKSAPQTTFSGALLLAFLGGLILNLMPCVFPVLSIKALSLVSAAEKHPALARLGGLAYAAGVILSFLAVAAALLALKAGGTAAGWGFQLQNPVIVALLAWLLFVIGLNLAGVFDVAGRFVNIGGRFTRSNGLSGAFFTGVLAAVVAAPCTAPFMAGAIGFALVQPAGAAFAIFAALGFGLALPYLLLSFIPALRKILPKPGAWMENFRQFLAFPMFASSAWLVWVLSQQVGPEGLFGALLGMVAIAFGLWLLRLRPQKKAGKFIARFLAVLSFLLALGFLPAGSVSPPAQILTQGDAFTPEKLEMLLEGDVPVFTEMTAAWCITCKINHAAAINIESTRKLFMDRGVAYLVGDWTNQAPAVTAYLESFDRSGVPLYVYYGPRDLETGLRPAPEILPQVLTPGIVKKAIEN